MYKQKNPRVPDLSRYDYYYNKVNDCNTSSNLSANAAKAASTTKYSRRTNSMMYSQELPSNLRGNMRTYSLTQNNSKKLLISPKGLSRSNSLKTHQSNNKTKSISTTREPIMIKTTQVKDLTGRTQSITTQTVKRINGYEVVETTYQTNFEDDDEVDPSHIFEKFTSDHMANLSEESLLNDQSLSITMEQDENIDSNSTVNFLPNNNSIPVKQKKPTKKHIPSHVKPYVKSRSQNQNIKKNEIDQETMYAQALKVAKKNVYGSESHDLRTRDSIHRKSVMSKRLSLRKQLNVNDNLPKSSMKIERNKFLTDDEMYKKALEVAKKMHGINEVDNNSIHKSKENDIENYTLTSNKTSQNKSIVKTLLNKMKQFSHEHYGSNIKKRNNSETQNEIYNNLITKTPENINQNDLSPDLNDIPQKSNPIITNLIQNKSKDIHPEILEQKEKKDQNKIHSNLSIVQTSETQLSKTHIDTENSYISILDPASCLNAEQIQKTTSTHNQSITDVYQDNDKNHKNSSSDNQFQKKSNLFNKFFNRK